MNHNRLNDYNFINPTNGKCFRFILREKTTLLLTPSQLDHNNFQALQIFIRRTVGQYLIVKNPNLWDFDINLQL